jgi:lipoprotein-anchoring transpeptidase ErfK/SrfK
MLRLALVAIWLCTLPAMALAQGWPPWAEEAFGGSRHRGHERLMPPADVERPQSSLALVDGGPRPDITPEAPPIVIFAHPYPAKSIVIDTSGRTLYFLLGSNEAYAYPISVGREGFSWTGTETISRKQTWPDWHPPAEMRERDPSLPEKMTGGTRNPLGAMALYLGTTLYRIHGTNDVKSIGQAQSSGCFRMMNANVVHLAGLADIGTTVTVVSALPGGPTISQVAPRLQPTPTAR